MTTNCCQNKFRYTLTLFTLILLSVLLKAGVGEGQPQNYFKGEQVAQLPSKALPRIGRRSDFGNRLYEKFVENGKGDNGIVPEIFPLLDMQDPKLLTLFKRLREDAFRPEEPTGIY